MTCHTLRHPNVLSISGIPKGLSTMSFVTPYMVNGTMRRYLDKLSDKYPTTPSWLLNKWVSTTVAVLLCLIATNPLTD